jgi:hypothetical protein
MQTTTEEKARVHPASLSHLVVVTSDGASRLDITIHD